MHPLLSKPTTPFGIITDPLVVHDQKLVNYYLGRLRQRTDLLGKFQCPARLALITWSNYPTKTIAEESFELLGIRNAVVLGRGVTPWKLEYKLTLTLEYLKSGQCSADVIFWMDARDAVLLGDPQRLLDLLDASGADILFSSTDWIVSDLPKHQAFARASAPVGCPTPYLNSGAIIAKRQALIALLEKAVEYVGKSVSKVTPTCDQAIFTVLQEGVGGNIAIDYWQRFALRATMNEPYFIAGEPPEQRHWLEEEWWWQIIINAKLGIWRLPALLQRHHTDWDRFAARWGIMRRIHAIGVFAKERGAFKQAIAELRRTPWFQ